MSTLWYTLVNRWPWSEGPQLASPQLFEVSSFTPDS